MLASIRQTAASHPKFAFTPTFIFCSSIFPKNYGIVFLCENIAQFSRNDFFSFDRLNMQIFTVNITRVVWPHVTNKLDLFVLSSKRNPLSLLLDKKQCYMHSCHLYGVWTWVKIYFFFADFRSIQRTSKIINTDQ